MSTMTYLGTVGTGKTGSIVSIYFLFPQFLKKIRVHYFFFALDVRETAKAVQLQLTVKRRQLHRFILSPLTLSRPTDSNRGDRTPFTPPDVALCVLCVHPPPPLAKGSVQTACGTVRYTRMDGRGACTTKRFALSRFDCDLFLAQ